MFSHVYEISLPEGTPILYLVRAAGGGPLAGFISGSVANTIAKFEDGEFLLELAHGQSAIDLMNWICNKIALQPIPIIAEPFDEDVDVEDYSGYRFEVSNRSYFLVVNGAGRRVSSVLNTTKETLQFIDDRKILSGYAGGMH